MAASQVINGTKVVKCDCVHIEQDTLHGKYMRVANGCKDNKVKCTICGKLHNYKSEIKIIEKTK